MPTIKTGHIGAIPLIELEDHCSLEMGLCDNLLDMTPVQTIPTELIAHSEIFVHWCLRWVVVEIRIFREEFLERVEVVDGSWSRFLTTRRTCLGDCGSMHGKQLWIRNLDSIRYVKISRRKAGIIRTLLLRTRGYLRESIAVGTLWLYLHFSPQAQVPDSMNSKHSFVFSLFLACFASCCFLLFSSCFFLTCSAFFPLQIRFSSGVYLLTLILTR
jgi:hypothetical protein